MELIAEVSALAIKLKQSGDVPPAEHAVLDVVDRLGPMTVPQIARERRTSRQNIQILVDRLEREGRVEMHRNPAHKRSALVGLTELGKHWLEASQTGREDTMIEIGAYVPEAEIREAIGVLGRIRKLLSRGNQAESRTPDLSRTNAPAHQTLVKPSSPEEAENQSEEFPINLL